MLATDFYIMDRKIYIGYFQRKSQCKSFGVQHAIPFFLILWRYMVFFNDITNQTVSQNIKKYTNSDTKNAFKRKYTNRSK